MPRGIRVRTECVPLVKQRVLQKGFARQIDLAERIGRSQSVINFFLNGRTVEYLTFYELCEILDFEVKEIADFEALASVYKEKTQKIDSSPSPSSPLAFPVATSDSPSLNLDLEYPEGEVPLDSPFYVERASIEQRCYEEIKKPGSLIRIKAPQHMGMRAGKSYAIVGVCDRDCRDLDIALYDSGGNLIASDLKNDDTPSIAINPNYSGAYRIRVRMASCNSNPCYYGVGAFGR